MVADDGFYFDRFFADIAESDNIACVAMDGEGTVDVGDCRDVLFRDFHGHAGKRLPFGVKYETRDR